MRIGKMVYEKNRKVELLYTSLYKGYKYFVFNLGTHPTAYVEIPKGNMLYEKDYDSIYDDYNIYAHGGLTYSSHNLMGVDSTAWFIGWDYAHAGDYMGYYEDMIGNVYMDILNVDSKRWTTEEIIEDCKNVIEQIVEIENHGEIE